MFGLHHYPLYRDTDSQCSTIRGDGDLHDERYSSDGLFANFEGTDVSGTLYSVAVYPARRTTGDVEGY